MKVVVEHSGGWERTAGCVLEDAIVTHEATEDIFIKPELEDVLKGDKAILLTQITDTKSDRPTPFDVLMSIHPQHKIEAVTVVCSVPKIEVFLGVLEEYEQTVYGTVILGEGTEGMLSFRYDIEIQKSGITAVRLKLFPVCTEICIFGIVVQIAPNPNGITTLEPNKFNMEKVHELLKDSSKKLSPGAEKCKMFMQLYQNQSNLIKKTEHMQTMLEVYGAYLQKTKCSNPCESQTQGSKYNLSEDFDRLQVTESSKSGGDYNRHEAAKLKPNRSECIDIPKMAEPKLNLAENIDELRVAESKMILMQNIDRRLKEFENRVHIRLEAFEKQQTAKLDEIIKMLQHKTNFSTYPT